MENHGTIGRRDFLKAAALSSVAMGAAGMLASCAPGGEKGGSSATGSENIAWDKEATIVVAGSGTGAFAALAAKKLGAESVILLEKGTMWGGTAATSGGGMAIPLTDVAKAAGAEDSLEEVLKYFQNASEGRANPAVVESFATNGNDFLNWMLETMGWQCNPSPLFSDYYEPVEGWAPFGRASLGFAKDDGSTGAAFMWTELKAALEEAGVEIMMETPATQLVTDSSGAVIGVKATSARDEIAIRADAVLLATGGFDHDDEMRAKHMPFKILATNAVATNTGDGFMLGSARRSHDGSGSKRAHRNRYDRPRDRGYRLGDVPRPSRCCRGQQERSPHR